MSRELIYQRIDEIYGKVDFRKPARVWSRYENLENYFGEYLSEELIESFLKDCRKDYILENLQTHDWKKLVAKIKQMFPQILFDSWSPNNGEEKSYFHLNIKGTKEMPVLNAMGILKDSEEDIRNISAFFGYEPTIGNYRITFEPRYAKDANDFAYGDCYGIVYHITSKENAEKILKAGLRVRTGDPELTYRAEPPQQNYRNFPKRIYLLAFDPKTVDIVSELKDVADLVGESEDMVALRIRLSKNNHRPINIYKDTAMVGVAEGNSFYTYTNIPATYIDYIINL